MQQASILEQVSQFVADAFLDGERDDLAEDSPLLEWGILDSMGMVQLVSFIEERFAVRIGEDAITPQNFRNLRAISSLVEACSLRPQAPSDSGEDGEGNAELRDLIEYGAVRERVRIDSGAVLHGIRMHGPGRTWVLLPEPGQPSWYYGLLQRTLESFHESLALDLAGSGPSHCANPLPTFWDQLALVTEGLAAIEGGPFVLVAHGASALIATEIARRHPERVFALVVIGYGALEAPDSGQGAFFDRDAQRLAREMYAGLHVPTLFVAGQDDRQVPADAVRRASAQVPASVVKWLARAGHALPRERPDELCSLIETFLKTLS
jgi:pimeloyl-ACP methyl ester carboxylesterase/acyl carrier protein